MEKLETVIVTGFGPFIGHETVNASWEAVKLLDDIIKVNNHSYHLEKIEVPVVYDSVNKIVSEIWAKKPFLVIHVGVHGNIETINLEHCAYTSGYCRPDYNMKTLECETVCLRNNTDAECYKICTKLDIEEISNTLNNVSSNEIGSCSQFVCSVNVGSYLCGYIYLKSLDEDPSKTLFIHVPPVKRPFSSEETSAAIKSVIEKCIEQLQGQQKIEQTNLL